MSNFKVGDHVTVTIGQMFLPTGTEGVISSISPDGKFYRLNGQPGGYRAWRLALRKA